MKNVFVLFVAIWAIGAWADVSEVRVFQPAPGQTAGMYKSAVEARAIQQKVASQEKLNATVYIGTDQTGNMQYVMTFPDWATWGAFSDKLAANKEWGDLLRKYDVEKPNATQLRVLYLDTPVVAKTQPLTAVYSWKVKPGRFDDFMATVQPYIAVDTALGGSIGVNIDELGNVHYEASFANAAAFGKWVMALQKSAERAALDKKANADPTAELVAFLLIDQYTGN